MVNTMDCSSDGDTFPLPPAPIKTHVFVETAHRAELNFTKQGCKHQADGQQAVALGMAEHSTALTTLPAATRPRCSSAEGLPKEIMERISSFLELSDVLSASQVCHSWLAHLRAGITQLAIQISPAGNIKRGRLALIAGLAPHLKSLCLGMGTMASQEALQTFFLNAPSMPQLQTLHLDFAIPQAPRRGIWPVFFWNILDSPALAHVTELYCTGSPMPSASISGLLSALRGMTNLTKLSISSRPHPGPSQLPPLAPPKWLTGVGGPKQQEHTGLIEAVHLAPLAVLTQLRDLQIELDPALAAGDAYGRIQVLTHLTGLTALELLPDASVDSQALELLASMTRLRSLKVRLLPSVPLTDTSFADMSPLASMKHVEDFRLRIDGPAQPCHQLPSLNGFMGRRLKWLHLTKLAWGSYMADSLAAFGGLRSLHMELDEPETGASLVDLSALTQLSCLTSFSLTFNTPGMTLHTPSCEYLLSCWGPKLEKLRLVGMRGSEMPHFRSLKGALSNLKILILGCAQSVPSGILSLHDLPDGLQQLDLAEWELMMDPQLNHAGNVMLPECRHMSLIGGFIWPHALSRLLVDLAATNKLQSLELVHVGPSLSDKTFEHIGRIHSLIALSIVATGNVTVNHSAVAQLSSLKHLEVLRWHVGDALDLPPMPDALAQLRSLVAWCITPALHAQLERWDEYAMLSALPMCDVWVETGL